MKTASNYQCSDNIVDFYKESTKWTGLLQINGVRTPYIVTEGPWPGVYYYYRNTVIPQQKPANITWPPQQPTDLQQRIFQMFTNVPLLVSVGPEHDTLYRTIPGSSGSKINVSTNFGVACEIPYSNFDTFRANYALGDQPASEDGQEFTRIYSFVWDRQSFIYDTGEGDQRAFNLEATLMQSPPTEFEQLTFEYTDTFGRKLPNGDHAIFKTVTTARNIDLCTREVKTVVYSSDPYKATFAILGTSSLGWFMFPKLGVVWRPTAYVFPNGH